MNPQALYWLDGTWKSLEVENAENLDNLDSTDFALNGHKHFKSDITDLPGNATTSQDGFMSANDKTKLNNIANNANNYNHPTSSGNKHIPSGGSKDQILRWSEDGTAVWGAENNTTYSVVTTSANGLMSSTDKTKLDGIAVNANNYTHPTSHPASIIVQDANNRFVTDTEKTTWNAKASTSVATTSANGLMSAADKVKLDSISSGTGNYVHPATHPASMITGLHSAATTGNADTAIKLADTRTLTIGNASKNFDGSSNVSWTLDEIGASASSHNHDNTYTKPTGTVTANRVAVFSDTTGRVIKDSGYTIATSVPSGAKFTDTVYTHPTTSGYKHIPSGGSTGQILKWSSSGTAVWGDLEVSSSGPSNIMDGSSTGSIVSLVPMPDTTPGTYSFAFGQYSAATEVGSIAIGSSVMSSGYDSFAEGSATVSSGSASHAEGMQTQASGDSSHAEGVATKATAYCAHAEGFSTKAIGMRSHAEGQSTEASGANSHAEGLSCVASGTESHAHGRENTASGNYSNAEGKSCTASGDGAHAEGKETQAVAIFAHSEGVGTTAIGDGAHAEGYNTYARGYYSHAEGNACKTYGYASHAEGYDTSTTGYYAHTEGVGTTGETYAIHVMGSYNKVNSGLNAGYSASNNAFVIGNGTSSARSNGFRVTYSGAVYGLSAFNSTGADYAEYFEWLDGNPNGEDRIGYFVALDENKIRLANSNDNYIIGIISGNQSIIGNACEDSWNDMYLRDDFDRLQYEDVEVEKEEIVFNKETDEPETKIIKVTEKHIKLNPNYDPNKEYVPRSERKEWGIVGMLGQIKVRDDGTCKVNSYCKPSDNGIATHSDDPSHYRVIERINDNLIRVVFK